MHPCCGSSLQRGTKIIAVINLVFSILFVAFGVFTFTLSGGEFVTSAVQNYQIKLPVDQRVEAAAIGAAVIFIGIFTIVFGVLWILLSALLLSGANKRNRTRCMIWFVIYFVLGLLGILCTILSAGDKNTSEIWFSIIGSLIDVYFLWVVWAFMAEIKKTLKGAPYGSPKPRMPTNVDF